jgi:hypothetical protein
MDWMIVLALTGSAGVLVAIAAVWRVARTVRTLRTILQKQGCRCQAGGNP